RMAQERRALRISITSSIEQENIRPVWSDEVHADWPLQRPVRSGFQVSPTDRKPRSQSHEQSAGSSLQQKLRAPVGTQTPTEGCSKPRKQQTVDRAVEHEHKSKK